MSAAVMNGVVRASRPPSSFAESNIAEFHAISIPRRTYTGDFWFARHIDGALWFVLGDVAGKGAASAVWMAMIQEELDALLSEGSVPAQPCSIVRRLDTLLREEMPPNRFATLVAGRLGADGSLSIANAGHPSPLLVRGDGSIERFPSNGPPVGILPNRCWGVTSGTLAPSDLLVTFSDGLLEARRADGTELGPAGAESIVAPVRRETARAAAAHIADELTRTALVEDDVTVLVVGR
ncbi:MAG TPA: PP2C family protein-serine/threonine phosphatase [Thermoanaerobaculia bacterium]|nr:PP2C family protein-serine/threonine phosphatase [Thermoanaerobaculia bacterium]